ncbi:hypothetical protein [Streptomyces sp. enrichment culture]|uniref:hypothetical protein n=1 Tax=Streptomyces sp. enrichment culture TaxID=1795815 RepID=UPI003F572E5F
MNKEERRRIIAEVEVERERLLPLREEATRTTIGMLRLSAPAEPPDLVPYLNLAYLLGVRHQRGDDGLMAFALSLSNWATAAIKDVAAQTGRTVQEVLDQYETELMEARMAQEAEAAAGAAADPDAGTPDAGAEPDGGTPGGVRRSERAEE